ncbi:MAG: TlpA family protein disulfide reductase [Deltaproteobacteria bacterium]|nr:TlpA family protein disulfide reductase [Deltaproteobacteria bacterium]
MSIRFACIAALAATAACASASSGGGVGRRMSDFTLPDLDGRQVSLAPNLAHQDVVVIAFWATWCRPCAIELPFLQDLYVQHRNDGFAVLAISMDGPESESQVRPTVRRYGWTFPVLLDRDTRVVGLHNPRRAAPYSIIIGRDGRVAYTHEGFVTSDRDEMRTQIERALALPRREE